MKFSLGLLFVVVAILALTTLSTSVEAGTCQTICATTKTVCTLGCKVACIFGGGACDKCKNGCAAAQAVCDAICPRNFLMLNADFEAGKKFPELENVDQETLEVLLPIIVEAEYEEVVRSEQQDRALSVLAGKDEKLSVNFRPLSLRSACLAICAKKDMLCVQALGFICMIAPNGKACSAGKSICGVAQGVCDHACPADDPPPAPFTVEVTDVAVAEVVEAGVWPVPNACRDSCNAGTVKCAKSCVATCPGSFSCKLTCIQACSNDHLKCYAACKNFNMSELDADENQAEKKQFIQDKTQELLNLVNEH